MAQPVQSAMRTMKLTRTLKVVSFSILLRFDGVSPADFNVVRSEPVNGRDGMLTLIQHNLGIGTSIYDCGL